MAQADTFHSVGYNLSDIIIDMVQLIGFFSRSTANELAAQHSNTWLACCCHNPLWGAGKEEARNFFQ